MAEPRREPMAGIVVQSAHFRGRTQGIGYAASCSLIIGGERNPNMAVVEDRVIRAVGLLDLIERLRDQEALEAVAGLT